MTEKLVQSLYEQNSKKPMWEWKLNNETLRSLVCSITWTYPSIMMYRRSRTKEIAKCFGSNVAIAQGLIDALVISGFHDTEPFCDMYTNSELPLSNLENIPLWAYHNKKDFCVLTPGILEYAHRAKVIQFHHFFVMTSFSKNVVKNAKYLYFHS
jgi:hypothetical protein